jgi:hypothetical protein
VTLDLSRHPETDTLVELLRAVPFGDTLTYGAMSEALGVDVTTRARPRLVSARRIALRDYGAAFETAHGVGLRRLLPDEASAIGAAGRRKIRRASGRARKAMISLAEHSNGLSPAAARRMSAEISAHGLISHIADDRAVSRLTTESDKPAPPAKVAESFLRFVRGSHDPNTQTSE